MKNDDLSPARGLIVWMLLGVCFYVLGVGVLTYVWLFN